MYRCLDFLAGPPFSGLRKPATSMASICARKPCSQESAGGPKLFTIRADVLDYRNKNEGFKCFRHVSLSKVRCWFPMGHPIPLAAWDAARRGFHPFHKQEGWDREVPTKASAEGGGTVLGPFGLLHEFRVDDVDGTTPKLSCRWGPIPGSSNYATYLQKPARKQAFCLLKLGRSR